MPRRYHPDDWFSKALKQIQQLIIELPYLTADDLREAMAEKPKHHNDWGAAMNVAQTLGMVIKTGRFVPSRHAEAKGRNLQVWISPYHKRETPDPDPAASYLQQSGAATQGSLL